MIKTAVLEQEVWIVDRSDTGKTTLILERSSAIELAHYILEQYGEQPNQPK